MNMKRFFFIIIISALGYIAQSANVGKILFDVELTKGFYIGQLSDYSNEKMGMGLWYDYDGNLYVGDFNHDRPEGKILIICKDNGKIKNFPEASFFYGNFIRGKKEGKGYCYDSNGNLLYAGKFENDKPLNKETHIDNNLARRFVSLSKNDGSSYIGEYKNSRPNGFGIYKNNEGLISIGVFKNGLINGVALVLHSSNLEWWELGEITDNKFRLISSSDISAERKTFHDKRYAEMKDKMIADITKAIDTGLSDISNILKEHESGYSASLSNKSNTICNNTLTESNINIDPNSTDNPYRISINEIDRRISALVAQDEQLEKAKERGYNPGKKNNSRSVETSKPVVNKLTGKLNKQVVRDHTKSNDYSSANKTFNHDKKLAIQQSEIQKEIRQLRAMKAEILNNYEIKKERTSFEIERDRYNAVSHNSKVKEMRQKTANFHSNQGIQNTASDVIWNLENDPTYRPELKGSERKAEIERQKAIKEAARKENQF